jgi:hypothetical protein
VCDYAEELVVAAEDVLIKLYDEASLVISDGLEIEYSTRLCVLQIAVSCTNIVRKL